MTEKPVQKKNDMVRALCDLFILVLLLVGAGFGGYYWGIHQQLAPVQSVAPGTPGAIPPPAATSTMPPPKSASTSPTSPPPAADKASTVKPSGDKPDAEKGDGAKTLASESSPSQSKHSKLKYWISSSGLDYIGYNITVSVNGQPVDSFYGPGKNVDITRLVNDGDNTITFDAKALGEQYNKHMGDGTAVLDLQLVKGKFVQENFKPADVVLSFKRSAVDTDDASKAMHFNRE